MTGRPARDHGAQKRGENLKHKTQGHGATLDPELIKKNALSAHIQGEIIRYNYLKTDI